MTVFPVRYRSCQRHNSGWISGNVVQPLFKCWGKPKEMIIDFREGRSRHTPADHQWCHQIPEGAGDHQHQKTPVMSTLLAEMEKIEFPFIRPFIYRGNIGT